MELLLWKCTWVEITCLLLLFHWTLFHLFLCPLLYWKPAPATWFTPFLPLWPGVLRILKTWLPVARHLLLCVLHRRPGYCHCLAFISAFCMYESKIVLMLSWWEYPSLNYSASGLACVVLVCVPPTPVVGLFCHYTLPVKDVCGIEDHGTRISENLDTVAITPHDFFLVSDSCLQLSL